MHEAGHAVVAIHFGFPLGSISIEAGDFYAGTTHTPEAGEMMTQHPDAIFGLEKEIIILMAGTEAVKTALPELARPPWGDGGDLEQVEVRVKELCMFTEEGKNSAKRRLRHMAGWYMADHAIRSAVVEVANELLEKTTLPKGAARKFVARTLGKYHRDFYPERFTKPPSSRSK